MAKTLIEAQNISKLQDGQRNFTLENENKRILSSISLKIKAGTSVGIIGESGSGKTTLVETLMGFRHPDDGKVLWEGRDFSSFTGKEIQSMRSRFQIVFQDTDASLNSHHKVSFLVKEGLLIHFPKLSEFEINKRVCKALEHLKLSRHLMNRWISQLSGGEKKRVALARALILRPELLVLDEPTAGLDVILKKNLLLLLRSLQNKYNFTLVIVSHEPFVVRFLTKYVVVVANGQIHEEGPTKVIFSKPLTEYTMKLIQNDKRWEG